jgi:branched-chain amino acid transport system substrate-binding protein
MSARDKWEVSVDELAEGHFEEAMRNASTLTRAQLLRRGAGVGAATFLVGGAFSGSALAARRRAFDAKAGGNILNTIFGPGGKAAGQGFTLQDGMLLAVTGQGSFYGRVMSRGAKLGGKQIGAAGGATFNISVGDHQSGLVPPAISATRRLVLSNKIETLQTSYGAPSEAIVPLIEQYKLLTFNGGGSSPGQLNKDYLWMTRMLYGADPAVGIMAYLAKTLKVKKLAIVGTLENAVETEKTTVPKMWPAMSGGGSVAITELHDVGITDFSTIVARVKATNPEAILTFSFGDDLGYQVKAFRDSGVNVPIIGVEWTSQAGKIAGKAFETFQFGGDFYDPGNTGNPFNAQWVAASKAADGQVPEFYGSNYYEHTFIMWELIRRTIKAGGNPGSSTDLQKALVANPVFFSVYGGGKGKVGKMTLSLKDHSISKPMGIFGIKNGLPVLKAQIVKYDGTGDPMKTLLA